MTTHVSIGIAAGLVAALLFSVVATGSPLGILLLYLAPLPILIVGIGWHPLVALLALAAGALVAGVSRGGQAADGWAEGWLLRRGVRRPRMWLGVAAAGASLGMSLVERRQQGAAVVHSV